LSSLRFAKNAVLLKQHKIKHILTVANKISPYKSDEINYKQIIIEDKEGQDIGKHLMECIEYIKKALKSGNVLVQ
jgi:hypothetical protein